MTEDDLALIDELGAFAYDPVGFVYWAFPWGEAGTELANETGPHEWQLWVLEQVRDGLLTVSEAIQIAITSGHGVGKSALVSWLVWWAFSTFPDTRGVVTANTENQLKTKTWVEISKWYRLFIGRSLFKATATALFSADEEHSREWRIDIVPWSERNTEAFAGLHNKGKRILIVFDEASAIPDVIWETTEGALTDEDTEIIWFVAGNPTRSKGRFRECFSGGKFELRWRSLEVDSRTVEGQINQAQCAKWIADYGLDSDFVRVRILGKFPRTDATSFISRQLAVEATLRPAPPQSESGYVLGVDVARFGDDLTVIYPRRGRDAVTEAPVVLQKLDTMAVATAVMQEFDRLSAVAIFVDGGGVGGGVVDRLAQMGYPVIEVQFGANPDGTNMRDPSIKYGNKRAEIWGGLRDFLITGSIPEQVRGVEETLVDELTGPSYSLNANSEIMLESKEVMKRRGVPSPNLADALALTFAYPYIEAEGVGQIAPQIEEDYNPFSEERMAS